MNSNLKKIVMTALFAALACVATMSIRIPTPGTGGYIHPGDAIVILSGVVLGPSYGLLAAGIGSAMSDLLGGYFVYVPITFVIKGLIALFSGLVYQKIAKDSKIMNFIVTDDNKYIFDGQEVKAEDLENVVSQHAKDFPDGLLIQVDDNADHGTVVKLMDSARNVGVTSISLSR